MELVFWLFLGYKAKQTYRRLLIKEAINKTLCQDKNL